MKKDYKKEAIRLRKLGRTYSEILEEIPVAKSTLSAWLRSVGLAKEQKQRLTHKRMEAQMRGAAARRAARLSEIEAAKGDGIKQVGTLNKRELFLIGTALYWAEGSKQYEHSPSTLVEFANSDIRMHSVILKWLRLLGVSDDRIYFELAVHKNRSYEAVAFRKWWERSLKLPQGKIRRVYLKNGNPKTNRHNTKDLYHGLLRIRVRESTSLNRKIHGFIEGIAHWGVV